MDDEEREGQKKGAGEHGSISRFSTHSRPLCEAYPNPANCGSRPAIAVFPYVIPSEDPLDGVPNSQGSHFLSYFKSFL